MTVEYNRITVTDGIFYQGVIGLFVIYNQIIVTVIVTYSDRLERVFDMEDGSVLVRRIEFDYVFVFPCVSVLLVGQVA